MSETISRVQNMVPERLTMLERGAEAMRARRQELIAQPLDRIWPELMKAALIAIREPTDRMICASLDDWDRRDGLQSISDSYRAMISATLKEPSHD